MKKYLLITVVLCISLLAMSQKFDTQIEEMVAQTEGEVIEWRHWFHQNAELSNREFKTAERIASILKEIGYQPQT